MNQFHKAFINLPNNISTNQRSYEILKIFDEHFPSEVIQLYRYSKFDGIFSGVLQIQNDKVKSLQHIHEHLSMNHLIQKGVISNKVHFYNDNDLQISIGGQYIVPVVIENILLVPISINNIVIAFISSINNEEQVNDKVLSKVESFRYALSYLLARIDDSRENIDSQFKNREVTVMQYVSYGYSTKEIAESMNFSEANIKYFIKTVMDKTNSRNRTEAIAELFRLGILS